MKVDENWDAELYKSGFAVVTLGKRRTFGQQHQEEQKSAGSQASSLIDKLRGRE